MTIEFTIKPFKDRPGSDIASCVVDGKRYEMVSRFGAEHAVCRLLRHDGIPDQPWTANGGNLKGPSIYKLADTTISDDDRGCRIAKFRPFPRSGGAQDGGSGQNDDH